MDPDRSRRRGRLREGPRAVPGLAQVREGGPQPLGTRERITRAAAAAGVLLQRAAFDEIDDVAVRRVLRALGEPGPLRRGQFAFEAIQQAVEHLDLAFVERFLRKPFPELRLVQDGRESPLRAFDRAEQAFEEPALPARDVEIAFLRALEDAVVLVALGPDLPRHAVEALADLFRARERHVGDRAGDPAVAVVERVNGHEPEMREARHQQGIGLARLCKPCQEFLHLVGHAACGRCFVVDRLAADRTRDDLHRTGAVVAPCPDIDLAHAAASGRKERGVPGEEPLFGQRLRVVACGVEHHLDDAFDSAVGGDEPADVQAESPRDRRADLIGREFLALDLARLDDVLGQRAQMGFVAQIEAEPFHLPEQAAFFTRDMCEQPAEDLIVPVQGGPVRVLPDISHLISALVAEIMAIILRMANTDLRIKCVDYGGESPQQPAKTVLTNCSQATFKVRERNAQAYRIRLLACW